VVFDFYDRLKSVSRGYASFDYHLTDYRPSELVKLQMLVNGEPVDSAISSSAARMQDQTRMAYPGSPNRQETLPGQYVARRCCKAVTGTLHPEPAQQFLSLRAKAKQSMVARRSRLLRRSRSSQ
jgi:hypothetical protein